MLHLSCRKILLLENLVTVKCLEKYQKRLFKLMINGPLFPIVDRQITAIQSDINAF